MAAEPIQCVFSSDDNYFQHLGAAIASLAENNRRHRIVAHVIHSGVSQTNMAALLSLIEAYPNLEARFYSFDAIPFAHFRLDGHISLASYFRLFLTDILPADIGRVIYLDVDLIVLGDLGPLWAIELDGALIGAVPDIFANSPDLFAASEETHPSSNERLGLPADYVYFNAGVLLIDLDGWRKSALQSTFVDYVEANHAALRFHDQDALNAVLKDRVKHLSYGWNFQAKTRYEDAGVPGLSKDEFAALAARPDIIHFTSRKKPWFYAFNVPFEQEYFRYLRLTPWRDYTPPDKTLRRVLGRRLPLLRGIYRKLVGRPI